MTVVYIDLLFLLNLIANYLLLLAAGRMAGAVLMRWRIGLGAAAGALYAVLVFLPGMGWLAHWVCKLAAGVLMALIAFGGEQYLLRVVVLFFGASAALAGAVLGLELLGSVSLTLDHECSTHSLIFGCYCCCLWRVILCCPCFFAGLGGMGEN